MKPSVYVAAIASTTVSALVAPVPQTKTVVLETGVGNVPRAQAQAQPQPEPAKEDTKYFHEPGKTNQLGHYDVRFFNGIVSYEERTQTRLHMIRAYLAFFEEHGLDTWIAHGTLLGWWWNGKSLPWDWDIDTQVSGTTLHHLGTTYNQSTYTYIPPAESRGDGRRTAPRKYVLDVNPWIWQRERGDGMNIIDARWIDTRNGLFIDITGLSETHPDTKPGVWTCKNYHSYKVGDLYPMRETEFEGVRVKVPYAYDVVLKKEYEGKALVRTEFQGHVWNQELKEWVPKKSEEDKKVAARR